MAKIDIRIGLSTDASAVRLSLAQNGQELAFADLDASDLDTVIATLGQARAGMTDFVPLKLDPNPRLPVTNYPSWWVYDPMPEGQIVTLRHPGFGWLGFLITQASADKMAGYLLKRATKAGS